MVRWGKAKVAKSRAAKRGDESKSYENAVAATYTATVWPALYRAISQVPAMSH